jgi:pyruvate dehydrogenase E2 component (dihydrolipoamide acetyltransferase)
MSQTQVTVPDLGGIDEVEVIEISIKVGDIVEEEQEILVLESDKATMEVPAPMAGKVSKILVAIGDKVSSGTPVVVMETSEQPAAAEKPEPVKEKIVKEEMANATSEQVESDQQTQVSESSSATETEIEIKVPDIGGAADVEVIEFSIQPGDTIEAEESLMVLESDKATMEVPSPESGKIISFSVSVGDKVSEGDVIGKMLVTQSQAVDKKSEKTTDQATGATETVKSTDKKAENSVSKSSSQNNEEASNTLTGKVHAGPAVRQLAREMGVDLTEVTGSGPRSRIIKEDVQQFVKTRLKQSSSAQAMGVVGSDEDFSKFGSIENVPLNKIKQVTAKNMVKSWSTIPQVTQFDEADITELEQYRKGPMAAMLPEGVKVSPLAFVLKACVMALQKFPQFNSSLNLDGTALITKQYYNLGIAVETPDGLLVPVIKDSDTKSIVDFAVESAELAGKARNKKLPMDGMMGGTFTVSSLGGIGGTAFTPIVAAPQVAILGVSKASYKPVWNGSEFEARLMLPLSLSYDHRVIDGAEAARFARYLCQLLSDTRHMLL